ncbi:restriction endonuclease [Pelagibacterium xiamenense]|uniref:restriction endonuclease n=1 Tax=Pelagibacterium xiamenense TaxID=2901140 RepID=UPI001E458434|nr:restriction endonuclease [Pelagibacterium xiamenense]MCD7058365.1 restriction endonuclease [Pelagibacterium xiamenense]
MARPSAKKIERATALIEAEEERREDQVCPLCGRPIPSEAKSSRHHLTPRLKGGARMGTVRLHQICHSAIHARFSEAEIARRLSDIGALRADPEIAKFIAWVKTKPPGFHAPTRMTRKRRAAKSARRAG